MSGGWPPLRSTRRCGGIIRLCGYLPLAIGMLGRQLRHHPVWTTTGRAAELASAQNRLRLMTTENLSVAAAFDLSYADLAEDQQRLFRRLGLHPGTDLDAYAAALDGISLSAASRGLEDLYDQHLLTEPAPGRYRLHDLLREHARALAQRLDPDEERDAAVGRLSITTSTRPPPRMPGSSAGDAPGSSRTRQHSRRSAFWLTRNRRWRGRGPSGRACWPAWTMRPPPAAPSGSPPSARASAGS